MGLKPPRDSGVVTVEGSATGPELREVFGRALKSLYMAFQPIVSLTDREVVAYEALVRTHEPALMRPDLLFSAAEALDMVVPMGRCIRAAVAALVAAAPGTTLVFVNLHAGELADEELYAPDAPLSRVAERVVLEITERWSLDAFHDVRERIRNLRDLGFRVAVDDLGAGYAGLTSFARLRPEIVKLDMSLIRGVNQDPTRQHLIRSLNAVCRDLGIQVVAEGVETREERDTLIALGSELVQGYLFSKPAPPFPTVDARGWETLPVIPVDGKVPQSSEQQELLELRQAVAGMLALLAGGEGPNAEWEHKAEKLGALGQRALRRIDRLLALDGGPRAPTRPPLARAG